MGRFSIPGYRHGGQFEVGGSGGPDSQLVAFRASPNERVTVERPGQDLRGGGDIHIGTIQIVANDLGSGPERKRIARELMQEIKRESARGKKVIFESGVGKRRLS